MDAPVLSQSRLIPFGRFRRERLLPRRGQVLTTVGSRVEPLDIIARAPEQGPLRAVPLARYLHCSEATLAKHLLKRPGEGFAEHEAIASKTEFLGTTRRVYRAPAAGHIASLHGIWLAMELTGAPVNLRALCRGTVVNVIPRAGAIIETTGAQIQGVWGTGGDAHGVLRKIIDAPGDLLREDKIDASVRGAVLLAGAGITEPALARAATERAAGVVTGGLAPRLREVAVQLGLPIIVTEGMAEHPMAAPIFALLASNNGGEISLDTSAYTRGISARPEIFIPAGSAPNIPAEPTPLPALEVQVGAPVRVVRGPHAFEMAKMVAVPKDPETLESGISAWGAQVELTGGEWIFVPWQNLELVG